MSILFEQQRPHIVRVPVRNDFQLAPDGIIHIAGCAGDGRFLNIVLSKGLGKLRILLPPVKVQATESPAMSSTATAVYAAVFGFFTNREMPP